MPRISRFSILTDGCVTHKTWHAHNDEKNLLQDIQKEKYLTFLFRKLKPEVATVSSYSVMSNHSHEIYTVENMKLFSDFMRSHHANYGMWFNQQQNRKGKVANERPTTTLVKDEVHEIVSVLYVHANMIEAGMEFDAKECKWTTHRLYGYGISDEFSKNVVFPDWYLHLGRTDQERQQYYLYLFENYIEAPGDFVFWIRGELGRR